MAVFLFVLDVSLYIPYFLGTQKQNKYTVIKISDHQAPDHPTNLKKRC